MVKCPHCGSTAQMRFIDSWETSSHLREVWDCCECEKRFGFSYPLKSEFTKDITPEKE